MYPAQQRERAFVGRTQGKRRLLNECAISADIDSMPYFAFQESTMYDSAGRTIVRSFLSNVKPLTVHQL
jgi:hypothetical protein